MNMRSIPNTKQTQKALDAQRRARIDSLAMTSTPMRLSDTARLPKGIKCETRWGKQQTVLSTIKNYILIMFYKTLRLIRNL
jgi:hypothetical protein